MSPAPETSLLPGTLGGSMLILYLPMPHSRASRFPQEPRFPLETSIWTWLLVGLLALGCPCFLAVLRTELENACVHANPCLHTYLSTCIYIKLNTHSY